MRANGASACMLAVAASLAGCSRTGNVEYPGEVFVSSPELITIRPNLQVVADADEPLFFAAGRYWLYRDGYWQASRSYRRGFSPVALPSVPAAICAIERPELYVQYRRHREAIARETYLAGKAKQAPPRTARPAPPPQRSTPEPETWQADRARPATPPQGISPD